MNRTPDLQRSLSGEGIYTIGKGEHMKTKPQLFIILLASLAGFMGGLISNQIIDTRPAFAVKEPKYQKVVVAEEFRVVDKDGKIIGSFGTPGYLFDVFPVIDESLAPVPQLRLGQEKGFQIIFSANEAEGTRIVMKDNKKIARTIIGNTEFYIPQTGITHRREVSSIVLFDHLGRFQWSAPGGVRSELGR
jgi:hypothetical protein